MTGEWLAALEAAPVVAALRGSMWVYPLVNAAHILGVALLVGGIVPLDLRLLGMWRPIPPGYLWQVLTRTAATGLVLAVLTGALLFSTRATEYAVSGLFLSKLLIISLGVINVVIVHRAAARQAWRMNSTTGPLPWRFRAAAGVSLAAWVSSLALGRLIGYF
ncbi:MAG: hypothetical protein WED00_14740 [Aquisalimonadaceae bacterium]